MKSFNKYLQERKYADREKEAKLSGGKSTIKINPDSESLKEADIKPPMEKLKTDRNMFSIPADEREAAKQRLLAKAKARREAMQKEELEIEEGMSMKDFKANRKKLQRKEASVDAEKRGHVGKEWHNTGRKYSPDEAKSRRANMSDDERAARHRSAVDPDDDRDENTYSADKTKNPKKLRKQKAMGEMLSFSDFMEARRMDKEGVDRGDTLRANRAERAKASVAAVKKRQAVLDKHEKKTGTKLDISRSKEGQEHARNHPGSRQAPKERGAKETPQETQNRRVNRSNARVIKHGFTKKEKEANRGMYSSRFD
jgi:hypothetical protein